MWQQKSFQANEKGALYLVPTPIGNLEDMTFRSIRILKEADIIAAEDTRQTKKLCNYFEIETPVMSYHEHNKEVSGQKILDKLEDGKTVALVSDAGMPCISDPGYDIVVEAVEKQYHVIPLPGANAALTALIASGLETRHFYFYGFLHRNKKERKAELEKLRYVSTTMMFYEAPHRLDDTLISMKEVLGNREIVLCRELTKKFEEFIRGSVEEAIEWTKQNEVRGEFCILVSGSKEEAAPEEQWWEAISVYDHIEHYINEQGMSSKDAIKKAAKDRDLSKRDVYQIYHVDKK
ncbi:16S rRNA (cytidine(1402)-2'-O)-methyltransferase [Bacillus pseudomycoides]|uniref:Ribosomal RNA small subunit methyltransferase I n=1 Tax=Bacillus pseudomycoides TaxID=64104 RepID=A0A2C3VUI4_9BACI|nr:16S rRNA (cytidine(1402)-2'-O)-methyltransferase [Bacillus pseudomycoides]PDY47786.1 16S rRNA (cytidine(1402)-2'-O)-methyltransferase [Bacillus pseudomycoides]PEA80980.1 16S rRNA (cytidine(1402)-2'-O)-methyltransferase [Bacillus pseudomycoides]PED07135.1 16S rRNA (cytidine(1402)-2'-O)-methyltransferase [Bacillus pseudomycoides]PED70394.1 16S rRNA (cytidine(1402)-2'-O)-methyltransferase [Bacillus pseudomycoides]PEI35053.1 16S rRNA (cytidine(1402)-2'-O)-methyltransferase [Bacillus pseudomycoi